MTNEITTQLDDVMAPVLKYLATQDSMLGIYPTTLDEFEEGAKAKAALSAMVEEIIGPDLPPDDVTDSGVGYSRQQFAINMGKSGARQRAVARGFIISKAVA